MRSPISLGLGDEIRTDGGIAPYAAGRTPGPLACIDDVSVSARHARPKAFAVGSEGFLGVPFQVRTDTFRLRQLNQEWQRSRYESVVAPEQALVILERALEEHRRNLPLATLLERAASRLAGIHANGTFILLWLRVEAHTERAASASATTPAALSPSSAPEDPSSAVEEPMMAAAQAAVLRSAAAAGVPFCEECAREAAEREAEMV
jgi:hypothetical protein